VFEDARSPLERARKRPIRPLSTRDEEDAADSGRWETAVGLLFRQSLMLQNYYNLLTVWRHLGQINESK
jgi:hypothetical protein